MLSMYTMIDNVEIFGLTLRGQFIATLLFVWSIFP